MAKQGLESLAPLALSIVGLAITVGIGAVVLAEMEGPSYDTENEIQTETDVDATTEPLFDLSPIGQGLDSVTVTNLDTGEVATEGEGYSIDDTEQGEIQIFDEGVFEGETSVDIEFDYHYEVEGTATDTLQAGQQALSTIGDFFTVIVVVGIAAVIFLLLGALRNAGRNGMA